MFHCCMKMSMGLLGCLVCWIACMYIGRTAPLHTKEHTRERRSSPLSCWRQSQITTYGFSRLCLVLQVVATTSIFLMSGHSTNSSWMVHTPKLILNLLLTNKYSTSYFSGWNIPTVELFCEYHFNPNNEKSENFCWMVGSHMEGCGMCIWGIAKQVAVIGKSCGDVG